MRYNNFEDFFEDRFNYGDEASFFSLFKANNISFNKDDQSFNKEFFLEEKQSNSLYEYKMPLEEKDKNINFEKIASIDNVDKNAISDHKKTDEEKEGKEGSTKPNSGKIENNEIKKDIFKLQTGKIKSKKTNWRMDEAKKHWKSRISNYAKDEINRYIAESDLPEELKKNIHIHSPNSKKFSANICVTANYEFLKYNLFQVFTIGKDKGQLQQQNEENISKIFDYFNKI